MKRRVLIRAVLLSIAVVSPLLAQNDSRCHGFVVHAGGKLTSPQEYTVLWPAVPGAVFYEVEERIANVPPEDQLARRVTVGQQQTSIAITHEAINDVTYLYSVRAIGNDFDCTTLARFVKTTGDPVLRRAVRRGIVPIVGSARGANGSLFRTYLRLEGAGLKGRIIFHPANRVASDDDPSIPYDTSMKLEWDDVVAAIGQSGLGSLSIVPIEGEVGQLPRASVRLYNVASNGIFGTNAEMYPAVGFLDVTPFQRVDVQGADRSDVVDQYVK